MTNHFSHCSVCSGHFSVWCVGIGHAYLCVLCAVVISLCFVGDSYFFVLCMVVISLCSVTGGLFLFVFLLRFVLCVVAISVHSMGGCCFSSFCEW